MRKKKTRNEQVVIMNMIQKNVDLENPFWLLECWKNFFLKSVAPSSLDFRLWTHE